MMFFSAPDLQENTLLELGGTLHAARRAATQSCRSVAIISLSFT